EPVAPVYPQQQPSALGYVPAAYAAAHSAQQPAQPEYTQQPAQPEYTPPAQPEYAPPAQPEPARQPALSWPNQDILPGK
ncbi:MAG TPA: hypothetical protein VK662_06685, partial [Acidothermaceae bacterium]|nr:hypothetical protein [Acidothermaceae bacterium]